MATSSTGGSRAIEVLHGANAIHGLGASGGIINLITRSRRTLWSRASAPTARSRPRVQRERRLRRQLQFSNRFGNADVLASLTSAIGHFLRRERRRDRRRQHARRHDGLANAERVSENRYDWEEQRIELTFNRYDIEGNNDWISVPASRRGNSEHRGQGTHPWRRRSQQGHKHRLDLHQRRLPRPKPARAGIQPGSRIDLRRGNRADRDVPGSGARSEPHRPVAEQLGKGRPEVTLAKDKIAGLPLSLVYGVDVLVDETWQSLIRTGRSWVPKSRYENYAPFLQAEFTGIDRLTVTAGIRQANPG